MYMQMHGRGKKKMLCIAIPNGFFMDFTLCLYENKFHWFHNINNFS